MMNRYQLIAIDKVTKVEYVVELDNDNKQNKGSLGLIDRGTSRFENEFKLATYLYKKGKIPTLNVTFKILYKQKGNKYLDVIYNDLHIYNISRRVDNKVKYNDDFVYFVLRSLLAKLGDPEFYNYIYKQNKKNQRAKYNGNFVDNKILDNIVDYYNGYIVPRKIDANTADIQHSLLKEFRQYKQLRTLFSFIKDYDEIKDIDIEKEFEVIQMNILEEEQSNIEEDCESINCINVRSDLYNKIYDLYKKGGMEAVYSVFDLDDIYDESGPVLVLK